MVGKNSCTPGEGVEEKRRGKRGGGSPPSLVALKFFSFFLGKKKMGGERKKKGEGRGETGLNSCRFLSSNLTTSTQEVEKKRGGGQTALLRCYDSLLP